MKALRLFSLAYMVLFSITILEMFVFQRVWPSVAVTYDQWWKAQPEGSVAAWSSYLSLVFLPVSLVGVSALAQGKLWGRWPFAVSLAGALLCSIAFAATNNIPQINSPAEYVLSDVTSLLGGIVVALSFIQVMNARTAAQPGAAADPREKTRAVG